MSSIVRGSFSVFCGIFRFSGIAVGMVYNAFRDTMCQGPLEFFGGWILLTIAGFNIYEYVNSFLATF